MTEENEIARRAEIERRDAGDALREVGALWRLRLRQRDDLGERRTHGPAEECRFAHQQPDFSRRVRRWRRRASCTPVAGPAAGAASRRQKLVPPVKRNDCTTSYWPLVNARA